MGLKLLTESTMSVATYTLGGPTHPPIHHDNGFLDTFPHRPPTSSDWIRLSRWIATLEAAEAAQHIPLVPHNDLSDALGAYRHFLFGHGTDRTFSYERYVTMDASGRLTLSNAILDAEDGAEIVYAANFRAGSPATFSMTGTAIPAGGVGSTLFPYPVTEDWQKAIGAHYLWISADVTVTPTPTGLQFRMNFLLHAEDRYNFNPGAQDITTGIPDSDNGVFEVTGLAQQYMNYSTLRRQVEWTGVPGNLSTTNGGPNGRNRQPGDNRRVRNRT